MSDDDLLRLATRFENASRFIQGFHYPPYHAIRDLRKLPTEQVIWREKDEYKREFQDQMRVEKMRFALEAQGNG